MFYFWNESSTSNISIRLSDIHLFYYEFCLIIEAANVNAFIDAMHSSRYDIFGACVVSLFYASSSVF